MTVICGGGTSSKRTLSPAVVWLSGETAVALAVRYLRLTPTWASLLGFAAGQSIDLTTFCATDPPAIPTINAADIFAIVTGNVVSALAAYQKLAQLIQVAAWYAFCQCDALPMPAPPAAPAYPAGGAQVNPGGGGFTADNPCWQFTYHNQTYGVATSFIDVWPLLPTVPLADHLLKTSFTNPVIEYTLAPNNDGSVNGSWYVVPYYETTGGGILGITNGPNTAPGTQTTWVDPFQNTWAWDELWLRVYPDPLNPPGTDNTFDLTVTVACDNSSGINSPCCPPDPQLEAKLDQLLGLLQSLYASSSSPVSSYAAATVHAGLSGNGRVTLVDPAIAYRVDITTDNPTLPRDVGNPDYLFDRGYMVPIAVEGPMHGPVRLVYNPQLFILPQLTEQIGYSLGPGIIASVTELVRGP